MSDQYQGRTSGTAGASASYTVTAMFDNRSDAEEAVNTLIEEGFDRTDVRLVPGAERDSDRDPEVRRTQGSEDPGFWASLRDLFLPDDESYVYAEGLRRGGYLVSVRTTSATHDRAVDILDDEGTIDLDERSQSWRTEGWTGYTGTGGSGTSTTGTSTSGTSTTGTSTTGTGYTGMTSASGATGSVPSTPRDTTSAAGNMAGRSTTGERGEQVIPIAEEQLRVGKRVADTGRVRVRSYVVEEPVSEQVDLREERVTLERRPVDRALGAGDEAFKERTVELDEKREEAVVDKVARVREELVVNKDVSTRRETVSDTVRKTEVDVQDDRNNKVSGTGTTGRDTDRRSS